jgi:hypothetical protein
LRKTDEWFVIADVFKLLAIPLVTGVEEGREKSHHRQAKKRRWRECRLTCLARSPPPVAFSSAVREKRAGNETLKKPPVLRLLYLSYNNPNQNDKVPFLAFLKGTDMYTPNNDGPRLSENDY